MPNPCNCSYGNSVCKISRYNFNCSISDIKIDSSYASILTAILDDIKNKPEAIESLVPLFFIARYLERIGDQATNIAEVNHFIVTGEVLTDDRKIEIEEETVF